LQWRYSKQHECKRGNRIRFLRISVVLKSRIGKLSNWKQYYWLDIIGKFKRSQYSDLYTGKWNHINNNLCMFCNPRRFANLRHSPVGQQLQSCDCKLCTIGTYNFNYRIIRNSE